MRSVKSNSEACVGFSSAQHLHLIFFSQINAPIEAVIYIGSNILKIVNLLTRKNPQMFKYP